MLASAASASVCSRAFSFVFVRIFFVDAVFLAGGVYSVQFSMREVELMSMIVVTILVS